MTHHGVVSAVFHGYLIEHCTAWIDHSTTVIRAFCFRFRRLRYRVCTVHCVRQQLRRIMSRTDNKGDPENRSKSSSSSSSSRATETEQTERGKTSKSLKRIFQHIDKGMYVCIWVGGCLLFLFLLDDWPFQMSADGDGKLDASEVQQFLNSGRKTSTKNQHQDEEAKHAAAGAIIKSFDKDKSGKLSYDEFET